MTPTLLCVDDDAAMTGMLHATLSPRGYNVLVANSVLEAVEIVQNTRVDLIILDVMMPEIDGFNLLERLANRPGRKIPVIMASGCGTVEARNHAVSRGAVAYLHKPFQIQQLLTVIGWAAPAPEPVSSSTAEPGT